MKKLHLITLLVTALAGASLSKAAIVIGGYSFDDNAFADTLISSSGAFTTSGGSLSSVLTDKDASTYAFSFSTDAYVELGFTDNLLVNGLGADLVLFELGELDTFKISIGRTTNSYTTTFTGQTVGGSNLNAISINLDDFGVARCHGSLENQPLGVD